MLDDIDAYLKAIDELKEQIASLRPPTSVTPTPAAHGNDILKHIKDYDLTKSFDEEGEAVLTTEENLALLSLKDEHSLVKALTKRLEYIFEGLAVVNSEVFAWLVTGVGHAPQKPDLFVCPASYYTKRIMRDTSKKTYPRGNRYGVISDERLYAEVALLDSKLDCNPCAFGELCIHLEHLGFKQQSPTRGMLFSRTEFWLLEQQKAIPLRFMKGLWTTNGSVAAIRMFFAKTLQHSNSINNLCAKLNVCAIDPLLGEDYDSGFLGQGAFGRVIQVMRDSDGGQKEFFALKFVKATHSSSIQFRKEHQRLRYHTESCRCNKIVRLSSVFEETTDLCGFLVQPVGCATCNREMIFETRKLSLMEVVQALAELHCHKPNPIIHGDPRLPNLIIHDKSLIWIDLSMNFDDIHTAIPAFLFAGDMYILIESLFPQTKRHVDPRIDELVNVYSQNLDSDSIAKLVEYLTELNPRI